MISQVSHYTILPMLVHSIHSSRDTFVLHVGMQHFHGESNQRVMDSHNIFLTRAQEKYKEAQSVEHQGCHGATRS